MIRPMILCSTLTMFLMGCGGQGKDAKEPTTNAKTTDKKDTTTSESLHGWWCDEHGVRESECSMCQASVYKKLKPKDLCPNHSDRAKDQCFICNPELWERSKAVYKSETGKEPPLPVNNMPAKK